MQQLKQQVFEANMDLPRYGLVTFMIRSEINEQG